MSLNWADWTIVAIVGVSCVISLLRGFIKEALSLASWIAATFVAIAFHERLAAIFARWIETPSIRIVLAYIALFTLTLLVGSIISWLVHQFVDGIGLGWFDRLLGMAFGAARGLLIVLALVILLPMAIPEMRGDSWWYRSEFIPHFEASETWARESFGTVMGWRETLQQKAQSMKKQLQ
ncbi:MAG: putative rane protein required for colicin production [Verrucomicrobiaceae bacterium]|nr:putative rane protein required for colicin production [Verrucomicrobiaceae bacterium]